MTQNILVDSPSLFTGNTLVTAIPVDFLLHQPNSSTNLKCRIRITTSGSSCSSGVLFLFVGFFWLVGWLVGFLFACLFVLEEGGISLLHLSGKVLTSTIMSATFSRPEITRLLTRTHKLSLHHALL